MEGGLIQNHTSNLPAEYQEKGHGINKHTGLPKLFRGLILGPSGSGKSNLVIDFIKRSPNIYTHLHLIARQPDQPLYTYLKDKLGSACTIYSDENCPRVDDIKKDGLQLVIFDDWSNDQNWCKAHVVPFFIRGRHKGLTTLFLAHAFHSGIPKMVRLNSEILMILRSPSKADLKSVLRDMPIAGLDDAGLWSLYSQVTKEKGQMLLVDAVKQQVRYNFAKVLHDGLQRKE